MGKLWFMQCLLRVSVWWSTSFLTVETVSGFDNYFLLQTSGIFALFFISAIQLCVVNISKLKLSELPLFESLARTDCSQFFLLPFAFSQTICGNWRTRWSKLWPKRIDEKNWCNDQNGISILYGFVYLECRYNCKSIIFLAWISI